LSEQCRGSTIYVLRWLSNLNVRHWARIRTATAVTTAEPSSSTRRNKSHPSSLISCNLRNRACSESASFFNVAEMQSPTTSRSNQKTLEFVDKVEEMLKGIDEKRSRDACNCRY
jgi:hypothetical protein